MNEMIDKLKKNTVAWAFLPIEDREMFESLAPEDIVWFNAGKIWETRRHGSFAVHRVYRIKSAYQPEPDTPVFPGYVLCEVIEALGGRWWFVQQDGMKQCMDYAPRLGCVGGVFKEDTKKIWNSLIMWVGDGMWVSHADGDGREPATLGWVVFKK